MFKHLGNSVFNNCFCRGAQHH